MTTTRRTALAMLGLIPTSGVGAETFFPSNENPHETRAAIDAYHYQRFASALEHLAAEIRKGKVAVQELIVHSEVEPFKPIDTHTLTLKFWYQPEAGP